MDGTSSSTSVSTKLRRIAELAKSMRGRPLTTLAHHIDVEFLREAFKATRKDGATGVDGQTAAEYAANLESNLESLLRRFKDGSYRAPPVRRVQIPKGDGKTRPLGIPTFEDKVLQRAVKMILEAVYEQDFHDCNYGFRPGRSAHQGLERLRAGLATMEGGWVADVDIKSFFDTLDHGHLRSFLDQRVRDGVIRRTIDKWLKAGVMEDGRVTKPQDGTPQGGVISPLLANLYLHEVLDEWFIKEVQPRMRGETFLVRYADDFVIAFAREDDANRVMKVLPLRFSKFGLTLHPDKTKLVPFERPPSGGAPSGAGPQPIEPIEPPGTFDLLGFTHYWGKGRFGGMVVRRKTMKKRMRRFLQAINDWMRDHRHEPLVEQQRMLSMKLRGHWQYYGVTGNYRSLKCVFVVVQRLWRKWLVRRSQKRTMDWPRFARLLQRFPLLPPRIVHSTHKLAANL